jgi:hypothetical protein
MKKSEKEVSKYIKYKAFKITTNIDEVSMSILSIKQFQN